MGIAPERTAQPLGSRSESRPSPQRQASGLRFSIDRHWSCCITFLGADLVLIFVAALKPARTMTGFLPFFLRVGGQRIHTLSNSGLLAGCRGVNELKCNEMQPVVGSESVLFMNSSFSHIKSVHPKFCRAYFEKPLHGAVISMSSDASAYTAAHDPGPCC